MPTVLCLYPPRPSAFTLLLWESEAIGHGFTEREAARLCWWRWWWLGERVRRRLSAPLADWG